MISRGLGKTVARAVLFGAFVGTFVRTSVEASAQPAAAGPDRGAVPAVAAPVAPSALLQDSLGSVRQAMGLLNVDKWKVPKPVKDTTATNVASIRRDVDTTLPGLLSAADAAPDSVAAMLPVSRNLSALYDVLLRVTVVADAVAPDEQTRALEQSMASIDDARRAFSDRLQNTAEAEETRTVALKKKLAAASPPAPAAATTAPPPCPATPAKKKKPAAK